MQWFVATPMTKPHTPKPDKPTQNHLLAALPKAEFERLFAHMEHVEMKLGDKIAIGALLVFESEIRF